MTDTTELRLIAGNDLALKKTDGVDESGQATCLIETVAVVPTAKDDLAAQLAKAIIYPDTDIRRVAIITYLLREFAADIKNGAIYGGL